MRLDFKMVKARANIEQVITVLGIETRNVGTRLFILCPGHDDHRISNCAVYKEKNFAYCFACGKSFSPVDLVMEETGKSYKEAMQFLWEIEGSPTDCVTKGRVKPEKRLSNSEMNFLGISYSPPSPDIILRKYREKEGTIRAIEALFDGQISLTEEKETLSSIKRKINGG